jgi:hypothetical protein
MEQGSHPRFRSLRINELGMPGSLVASYHTFRPAGPSEALSEINQRVHLCADQLTCWKCTRDPPGLTPVRARLCIPAHPRAVTISAHLAGFLSPFKPFMPRVRVGSVLAISSDLKAREHGIQARRPYDWRRLVTSRGRAPILASHSVARSAAGAPDRWAPQLDSQ